MKKICITIVFLMLLSTLYVPSVQAAISHDLAVTSLSSLNGVAQVSSKHVVNATVSNLGSSLERNVEVRFLVNGSLSQTKTVAALKNSSYVEMSFLWTPQTEATYNLTVYVPPVPGETNMTNNAKSSIVKASIWMPTKQVGYGDCPSMATDSNGYLYATYHQYSTGYSYGYEIYVSRSTDGGYSWTQFGKWSHPGYRIGNPSIAIDPYDNRVYVAYEVERTTSDHDLFCKVYVPGQGWVESVQFAFGTGDHRFPSITSEYQYGGNWQYIVFEELIDVNNRNLYVIRSTDHGVTWPTQWEIHGYGETATYTQARITNSEGNLYVVYRRSTSYYSVDGDIRVDISSNFGVTWTTVLDVDGTTGDCWYPSIAATHGGDLVIVAFRYSGKVLYSYSQFKGSTPWQKGHILDPQLPYSDRPELTVDGGGSTSNSIYGYVHAAYIPGWFRGNEIFYRKVLWYEPTNWSERQNITSSSNTGSAAVITTQNRSSGAGYFPCVAFPAIPSPYIIQYSTVTPLPFNYSLSVSPSSIEVEAGSWTTYQVDGTLINGPAQTVTLTLYGLPSGVAFTQFTSKYVTPSSVSTLIVGVYNDAPDGNYSLAIVGEGGGVPHSATFNLRIKAKPKLTLSLTPSTVPRGQNLTISGQLTPSLKTTIRLYYRTHSTGTWGLAIILPTDSNGVYKITATVPTGLTPGSYDLVAVWFDEPLGYTASPIMVFTIT